ncbi:MAG: DEAD/DEAH box helicase [Nanoarchaeota archaeon]|nr:MAG: DEAD/DEAH box helicase [Nanoarchaeota archaeon]
MNFDELPVSPALKRAVKELGYTEATPIQEKSIPIAMQGTDLVAQSKTGSGKTAAFALPILDKVQPGGGIQAIILIPTRELCVQVTNAIQGYGKYKGLRVTSVYGGVSIEPQFTNLRRAEIVVATPGRTLDHIQRGSIDLSRVKILVLDEADKMLEMGFIDDIERIIRRIPTERQTMLFSATIPDDIQRLIQRYIRNPKKIEIEIYVDHSKLKQVYYEIDSRDKFSLLLHLVKKNLGLTMVFCSTRREVDIVASNLRFNGVKALAIHGGHTQNKRSKALEALKSQNINVLVATDVAARGIDVKDVMFVYNYDSPKSKNDYIHRIGRTAREGKTGEAITLLIQRDHDNFSNVLRDRTVMIDREEPGQFARVPMQRGMRDEGPRQFHRGPRRHSSQGQSYGASQGGHRRASHPGRSWGQRRSNADNSRHMHS